MMEATVGRSWEGGAHAVTVGVVALVMGCVTELPGRSDTVEDGADDDEASCPGRDDSVSSEPPTAYSIVGGDVPRRADGLPLFESNPGANVAMFVDFDGGTYRRSSGALEDYGAASLDGDRSTFNADEQAKILRAVTDLAANYAAYDVNVTTDPSARRRSPKWTWLLVTNDYGSRSGRAQIDDIGRKEYANGLAGTLAVLEPRSYERPAYLLTHEFGHTFGLEHAGRFSDGDFEEYSDYASGPRGAFMGGRGSQFDTYRWRELRIDDGSRQDPDAIIAAEAGYRSDGGADFGGTTELGGTCAADGECRSGNCHAEGATDRCRPATCTDADAPGDREFCETDICGPCRVSEGDCDADSQCLGDATCGQRSGPDYCVPPRGCVDDASFVDAQGYDCDGWDGYDCDDATARYGYSQREEDAIVASCPRTCGVCS